MERTCDFCGEETQHGKVKDSKILCPTCQKLFQGREERIDEVVEQTCNNTAVGWWELRTVLALACYYNDKLYQQKSSYDRSIVWRQWCNALGKALLPLIGTPPWDEYVPWSGYVPNETCESCSSQLIGAGYRHRKSIWPESIIVREALCPNCTMKACLS